MQNMVIRLELGTPVIPGYRFCLDGLLSGLLFEQTGSVESALSDIPLARRMDVWQGSAALYEDATRCKAPFVYSLRADHDLTPHMVRPGRGQKYPTINPKRLREFGNEMHVYDALAARAVWFFGHGDMGQVETLLSDVQAIGKKRQQGFGAVVRSDIEEVEGNELWGLADLDGFPMRPIPLQSWEGRGDTMRDDEAYHPPYWQPRNRF